MLELAYGKSDRSICYSCNGLNPPLTAADRESRASRRETEWSLNKDIFNAVVSKLGS